MLGRGTDWLLRRCDDRVTLSASHWSRHWLDLSVDRGLAHPVLGAVWYNYRCVAQGLRRRLESGALPHRPLLAELDRALLRWYAIVYWNMSWGCWRGHWCCNQMLWYIHHNAFLRRLCEYVKLVDGVWCSEAVWMRFRSVCFCNLISYLWHSHYFLTADNLLWYQLIWLFRIALRLTPATLLCTILAMKQIVRANWYLLTILFLLLLHNDILVLGFRRSLSFQCLIRWYFVYVVVNQVLFNVLTRARDILASHPIINFEASWVNWYIWLLFLSLSMLYRAWKDCVALTALIKLWTFGWTCIWLCVQLACWCQLIITRVRLSVN